MRIAAAIAAAVTLRLLSFGILNLAVGAPMLAIVIYLLPVGVIGGCIALLADPRENEWFEVPPRQTTLAGGGWGS